MTNIMSPPRKSQRLIPEEIGMNNLMTNPGYSIITQKIIRSLDHKSHLAFRLVGRSWKMQVDCPYVWLKKCFQKGMNKDLYITWIHLLQGIEKGSSLEVDTRECLMMWYGFYHYGKSYYRGKYQRWSNEIVAGLNPIHMSAVIDYINIVKYAELQGVNSNASTDNGKTPIHLAAVNGYTEIVKFLATKTKTPNAAENHGATTIHLAAHKGHTEIVKFLATKTKTPNAADNFGLTPIHLAAREGHTEIVKFLVTKTETPNAADNLGWTPLHTAAFNGHTEVVKFFVSIVDNINIQNSSGETPLQLAKRNNHTETVKILRIFFVKSISRKNCFRSDKQ